MMATLYHSDPFVGDLFRASGSAYITPQRWQEFWEQGLVATDSDCMSPRLTQKGIDLLQGLTNASSATSSGYSKGADAGDWSDPGPIAYDAADDAQQGD